MMMVAVMMVVMVMVMMLMMMMVVVIGPLSNKGAGFDKISGNKKGVPQWGPGTLTLLRTLGYHSPFSVFAGPQSCQYFQKTRRRLVEAMHCHAYIYILWNVYSIKRATWAIRAIRVQSCVIIGQHGQRKVGKRNR
jgi:hypothetical protein